MSRIIVIITSICLSATTLAGDVHGQENASAAGGNEKQIRAAGGEFDEAEGTNITILVDNAAGKGLEKRQSAVLTENGEQLVFLNDELIVEADSDTALSAFLERWNGKVVDQNNMRYRVAIRPDAGRMSAAEKRLEEELGANYKHSLKVSDEAGKRLLAAAAAEDGRLGVTAHVRWLAAENITAKRVGRLSGALSTALQENCGYRLRAELQLIQDIVRGGPRGQQAEQMLLDELGDPSTCRTPPPTYDLGESCSLTLPFESAAGRPFGPVVLNPPPGLTNFSAEILSALDPFINDNPIGGRLYGGSLYFRTDGNQMSLSTPETFVIPQCAQSETFTFRLTDAEDSVECTLTVPIGLSIPGFHNYTFRAGQNAFVPLCAAGARSTMTWSWQTISGSVFPPQDLILASTTQNQAQLAGPVNVLSYQNTGRLRVAQNAHQVSSPASIRISVDFYQGNYCAAREELTPGQPFRCELPRPIGYLAYAWTLNTGSLPPGLTLVNPGLRWYVEGTVPIAVSGGPRVSPVGLFSTSFELTAPGSSNVLSSEDVEFSVGLPLRVWTQNAQLRPNNPFTQNTGDDNEERADAIIARINQRVFDVIALQEAFDDDQRNQIALGRSSTDYVLRFGPSKEGPRGFTLDPTDAFIEDSGLMLLFKTVGRDDEISHSNSLFHICRDDDCRANKGFSLTKVPIGSGSHVWVVNTHLQAAYKAINQYDTVRNSQRLNIDNAVNVRDVLTHPVILLGDLNIVAGDSNNEYVNLVTSSMNWIDVAARVLGVTDQPITADERLNAYAHFWHDGISPFGHLFEHLIAGGIPPTEPSITFRQTRLDYVLIRQGSQFALEPISVEREDTWVNTDMCQNDFPMTHHPGMRCYLSDHFGLSAELRYVVRQAIAE